MFLNPQKQVDTVVVKWFTYPLDSDNGLEGMPLEYLMGPIYDRYIENFNALSADGHVQRSRGGDALRLNSIEFDGSQEKAIVDACLQADHEIVDANTGDVLNADIGTAWRATVILQKNVHGRWRVFDVISNGAGTGNDQCSIFPSSG